MQFRCVFEAFRFIDNCTWYDLWQQDLDGTSDDSAVPPDHSSSGVASFAGATLASVCSGDTFGLRDTQK
eukprot:2904653-Lingulodinium_polyedra.AAC.1